MVLLTSNLLLDTFGIFVALLVALIAFFQWSHTYWSRKGLETPPVEFIFGNAKGIFLSTEPFSELSQKFYNFLKKKNVRHGGCYFLWSHSYIPVDPTIIKHLMSTDFQHFMDRGTYINEEGDPLSAHLFSLQGQKWKDLRTKLTPTFTSGKMKMMFETLKLCSDELKVEMDRNLITTQPIDIKDLLIRYTTDIIGSCAFGIDCNSLKNPDNEFSKYGKMFFIDDFWQNIIGFITFVAPNFMKKMNVKAVKPVLAEFFMNVVKKTVNYREVNNIYRKDFMHLLIQLKNRGELFDDQSVLKDSRSGVNNITLTIEEIAAQAFIFFLAGFETSSTTMTFCMFELVSNPKIQDKLRDEINTVLKKHNGEITYDAIMEMTYMQQVVDETLRKYPPLPILNRVCTKRYQVPETDFVLEKGDTIIIPVLGVQRDAEYFPEPEKFKPERFSEENKKNIVPYTYLPFGEGPRICIGLRFGMMQTKVGLTTLLKNYKFTLSDKTNVPLKMDPKSFILATQGGIWLNYEPVS